jgi:putative oxidoreductase
MSAELASGVDRARAGSGARFLVLVGRILFAAIFVVAAPGHFQAGTVAYAASAGVPMPSVAVPLAGIIALVGGLSVAFGFRARIGAWLLVLFLVPVTLYMHRFWGVPDVQNQVAHFMKNVAMLGGALLVAWYGAGPVSLDARRTAPGA